MADYRCIAAKALLILVLMAATVTNAAAEVGVFIVEGGPSTGYVLQSIIDETEPVGIAWVPFFPAGPQRSVLNPTGAENGDGPPSLILGSGPGFPVVAWSKNSPTGHDIVVSRFDDGSWTTPQIVASAPGDELDPYLVLDPNDGSFHIVYWVADVVPRVMYQQAPSDLSSWSAPVQVSHPADVSCRPSGVFHDGQLWLAYERHAAGYGLVPREIVTATGSGETFSSEVVGTTQFAGENRPEVHSADGQLWIDWVDSAGDMAWIRQTTSSSWDPIQAEQYDTQEERDFHVRGLIRQLAIE